MMMRLLIHHARPLYRRAERVPLGSEVTPGARAGELGRLESVLSSLAAVDSQLRTIVEMKVFEGLSVQEIAGQLGCSTRTVDRRWNFAKHWLENELR